MESLSDEEVEELAKLYPAGIPTVNRLSRAGFDPNQLPATGVAANSRQYWNLITSDIAAGIIEDGRRRVLEMARSDFRYNEVLFGRAAPSVWRVIFLGASPAGLATLRTDREYRHVIADIGGRLSVSYHPLATASDLSWVRRDRPHVLHLACHGRGNELLFDDGQGGARVINAEDLATALVEYERIHGWRLHGIVINACDSAKAAEALRRCADGVVAHGEALDDTEAVAFAGSFYRALIGSPSVADAGWTAKAELVLADARLRRVADALVICGRRRR